MKKAKIFISHHPNNLFLYKNLVKIIRNYDKDSKIILFKANHPAFLSFDFLPYKEYFDEIVDFGFVHYKKNFFLSYWEILNFKKKLKKIINEKLSKFDTIDLFLNNSAWLPINVLLYHLSKQKNIKNINKFTEADLECSHTKIDKIRTFLCTLYSLPFGCYKVRAISTLKGKFINFAYREKTPGKFIKILNPNGESNNLEKEDSFPFPVVVENSKPAKKDMVIMFGDATIHQFWQEYFPAYETFLKKLTIFLNTIENKYRNCKLYYKPHPTDGKMIMPGVDVKKYNLLDNTTNAQTFFDKYHERIKAIYSISSTSVMMGSFFGIPSYTFYRYICNKAGIDKFNIFFNQDVLKSKFIFHIADLDEIGKIDNMERVGFLDFKNLKGKYRKILNI